MSKEIHCPICNSTEVYREEVVDSWQEDNNTIAREVYGICHNCGTGLFYKEICIVTDIKDIRVEEE